MARVYRLNAKDTVTERVTSLLRQLLILFLVVVIGVLVSVSVNAQNLIQANTTPTLIQHELIREMVTKALQDESVANITISPLEFALHQNQFKAVDINPLFIAVEFARQGKTIQIDSEYNRTAADELAYLQLQSIKEMMQSMGVPKERIALSYYNNKVNTLPFAYQKINRWQIEFKVL